MLSVCSPQGVSTYITDNKPQVDNLLIEAEDGLPGEQLQLTWTELHSYVNYWIMT